MFCDIACSAPYIREDLSFLDAFFVSPHKFIGGVETPGMLVAKTCLFQKSHSLNPGGSCMKTTHNNEVVYSNDIEIRESAGTPNIIGIIKIGQCLLLKERCYNWIAHNEACLAELIQKWHEYFEDKYPETYRYIHYDDDHRDHPRLPIFSFNLSNLHYNFVVVLLNDIYGIQTRGGKVCTGLFNDHVKKKYGIEGFCRISLHWTMTKRDILYIFNAVNFVAKHGDKLLDYYTYDDKQNLWNWKE
jgi:selenocysteine lyase/cysteine desulfurase